MKTIDRFMHKISKRTYAVAAIAVAVVAVPAALFAWGPASRVTFTMEKPADYVTFNSITNNNSYGDERNFVQVRNVTDHTAYTDNATLIPGKEYEVRAYYHNNASTSLNDSAHDYAGIATGTFMRTEMPATVAAGADARVTSYVGAANAKHLDTAGKNLGNQVWDEAYGKNSTGSTIALSYVSGSAKITSGGAINGKTLPDTLFNTGTALGYTALDGKVPGCAQYSGYVTYRFKVDQPNFTIEKTVSATGTSNYVENLSTTAGATVDFKMKYQNTGTTTQHVTIRDQLPAGFAYIAGSTYYSSSLTNNQWKAAGYDTVTQQGLGLGTFAPGAMGFVKFSAKVVATDKLACGVNTLINTASADTENGSKSDTATVTVNKTCTQVPVYKCDNLTVSKISRTEFGLTATKTVQHAAYVRTAFVVKNAAGTTVATVNDADGIYTYTQTTPGTYTVTATIVVTVNGVEKTATSAECVKTFTVEPSTAHPAVEINKTVNGKEAAEIKDNQNFQYEITVKNTGDIALVNAKVSDAAPAGITFLSADAGTITNNAWSLTVSLRVGESKSFKITAVAKGYIAGTTINKACVDATEVTGSPDDCDTASTTMLQLVTACNLSTKKVEYGVEKSKIDNIHYTLDLTKCAPQPNSITVCRLSDQQIVTIKESDFDASKHSKNLDDCRNVTVCKLETKKIVTITVSEYNQHKDKYSANLNDCKDIEQPNNITVCRLDDKTIVTISETEYNTNKSKYSTDLNDCKTTTAMCTVAGKQHLPANSPDCKVDTPAELPRTGVANSLFSVIGAGSLAGMAGAYAASRRAIKQN
jgi:uncharacterized repeat protein (TIGR01451 family)